MQLRRADGIVRPEFLAQTGFALDELVGSKIRELVEQELLRDNGNVGNARRRHLKSEFSGDKKLHKLVRWRNHLPSLREETTAGRKCCKARRRNQNLAMFSNEEISSIGR